MNRTLFAALLATLLLGGCGQSTEAPAVTAPGKQRDEGPVPPPAAAASAGGDAAVNASIDKLLGDHASYQAVIEAYQDAVATGDRPAVAALVAYPITIDRDGSKTTINDPAAFVRDYDRIFTPGIIRAVKAQKYSGLMVNSQGVMFGSGETWINGVCREGSADCSEFEAKVVAIQAGARD